MKYERGQLITNLSHRINILSNQKAHLFILIFTLWINKF
jgi:hypothetical protein